MPNVEFFTAKARLQALVVDYVDVGTEPDIQNITSTIEFIPRLPAGSLAWAPGLTIPSGIALPPIKARTDPDGYLRAVHLSPVTEIQTITMNGSSGTIAFNGSPTVAITNTMTNLQVKAALESLPTIGAGNVGVSGAAGVYEVSFVEDLGYQNVPTMAATGATVAVTQPGALNDGVELVANTEVLDLDELIYDVRFTNVVFNKNPQVLSPFAFAAPTTAGVTLNLAEVPKLTPKPGI